MGSYPLLGYFACSQTPVRRRSRGVLGLLDGIREEEPVLSGFTTSTAHARFHRMNPFHYPGDNERRQGTRANSLDTRREVQARVTRRRSLACASR
jgi:hypothetical protein